MKLYKSAFDDDLHVMVSAAKGSSAYGEVIYNGKYSDFIAACAEAFEREKTA